VESRQPDSQLQWFKRLIELRRMDASLHGGAMTMLDAGDPSVLAYERKADGAAAVVVAMNFTAEPKTISLDVAGSAVKTLATDDPALRSASSLKHVTLAPFSSWVARVQ